MYKPLDGIKLLAFEQADAGPFGTQLLAGLGAEVIKIEHQLTRGDHTRRMGPFDLGQDDSLYFQTYNRSKRSLTLDLHDRGDRRLFDKLVQHVDGVVTALRGDTVEKLELDYPHLKALKSSIVCAHLTAYGRYGPRAHWPAYSAIIKAELGLLGQDPDNTPMDIGEDGGCGLDVFAGALLATGVLSGLLGAHRTGKGCDIDITLFESALHQHGYLATWMLNGAKLKPERADRAQHPSAAPSQVFQTRDGWILVMCQRPKFWDALCHVLDCKDWLADPRFDNPAQRRSNAKALEFELQKVIERQTSAYWLECLQGKVPVAVVQSFEEALSDNFVADHIQRVKHDQSAQDLRVVKDPIAINGQVQAGCAAPALNGDAEDILRALLQREDDQQSAAE